MLEWFVTPDVAKKAMKEKCLIDKADVEVRPHVVPPKASDTEKVNILRIQSYFTDDAWIEVCQVVDILRQDNSCWKCKV